jgi:4-hydroxybenzoate polyprenyltransferase
MLLPYLKPRPGQWAALQHLPVKPNVRAKANHERHTHDSMSETTTSSSTPVADAVSGNWTDRYAPESWRPYLRLARMDRPVGTWLLLFPCWWSVALAQVDDGQPYPNLWLLVLFAVGAFVMRGAGCAYNDYVDRDFDAKVERTASRPIPSGQIIPEEALIFVVVLSLIGFAVLMQFNWFTVILGAASLLLVAAYPFTKRYTYWPQLVLGLTFNWGALVGWTAVKGSLAWAPAMLYLGSVLWTVGYDTIYAHQDADDDAVLGLKSTALRFGDNTPAWVGGFYSGAVVLWTLAGFLAGAHLIFFLSVALVSLQLAWQVSTLNTRDPQNCLWRFRSNRDVGAALFLGLAADMLLSWWSGLS